MKYGWFLRFCVLLCLFSAASAQVPKISLFSEYGWKETSTVRFGVQTDAVFALAGFFMDYAEKSGDIFVRNWYAGARFDSGSGTFVAGAAHKTQSHELPFSFKLTGGTLSFSGVYSRLNKPVGVVPQALKQAATPQTGLIVTSPSFSSSSGKILSLASSFSAGPVAFALAGRLPRGTPDNPLVSGDYTLLASAQYSFPYSPGRRIPANALRGSVTLAGGRTRANPKKEDSWYTDNAVFAPTSGHFAVLEGELKNTVFGLFSSNGLSEHPDGTLRFFTRNDFSVTVPFFVLNGGFTLTDAGYLPLNGSSVRQTAVAWFNPQGNIPLSADRSAVLRFGFLASLQHGQSPGSAAVPYLYAGFKGSAELTAGRFFIKPSFAVQKLDAFHSLAFCAETQFSADLQADYRSALYRPLWKITAGIKGEWNALADFDVSAVPENAAGRKSGITSSLSAVVTPFTALEVKCGTAFTVKNLKPHSAGANAAVSHVLRFDGSRLETSVVAEFSKKLESGVPASFSVRCSARLRL